METTILGIINNYMYLAPFYGGDNDHKFIIDKHQKQDLLDRGVEEFNDYSYIEAKLYGLSYVDYIDMLKTQAEHNEESLAQKGLDVVSDDDDLPF